MLAVNVHALGKQVFLVSRPNTACSDSETRCVVIPTSVVLADLIGRPGHDDRGKNLPILAVNVHALDKQAFLVSRPNTAYLDSERRKKTP